MVFNNIVVAYDGSDHAVDAVMKARDFALADPEVRIHVVFVTTHPNAQLPASFNNSSFDPEQYLLSVEDVMDLYNRTIAEESEKVKAGLGVAIEGVEDQVTIDVIPGYTPADDIIEFAKEIEADLIVMGSRGLGAIRGVIGSVSYAVLRRIYHSDSCYKVDRKTRIVWIRLPLRGQPFYIRMLYDGCSKTQGALWLLLCCRERSS